MVADGERPHLKTICRLKTEGGSLSSLPSDGISNAAFAPYAGGSPASFQCLRRMPVASGKPCAGWLCRLKQYEGMRFRRHPPVAEIPSASCPIIA
ncbi:hypothetical protein A6J53_11825 [Neisseria meningitidis]|nr:hypothetical protein A6J53_11825 [Neisseria meningitidis]